MATINVIINKQPRSLPAPLTARQALAQFGPQRGRAALWINGQAVLLAEYDSRLLAEGDDIKIIRISGGG
jgi:thiamine biosynthesis protein ThiS